jgi:hypothetical protein
MISHALLSIVVSAAPVPAPSAVAPGQGTDLTGHYTATYHHEQFVVEVLSGDRQTFFRVMSDVVREVDGSSCVCAGAGELDPSGGYKFTSGSWSRARVENGTLTLTARNSTCCARIADKGQLSFDLSKRYPSMSCSVSGKRAYFHDFADHKRRGAYVVSGDPVDVVYAEDEWMAARFKAGQHSRLGLLRTTYVDCREPHGPGATPGGTLPYRVDGTFSRQDDEGKPERTLHCDGTAGVFTEPDEGSKESSKEGTAGRCYLWHAGQLSCEGSHEPDRFAEYRELAQICLRKDKWIERHHESSWSACQVTELTEESGVLRSLRLECGWECPRTAPCNGGAFYELGTAATGKRPE